MSSEFHHQLIAPLPDPRYAEFMDSLKLKTQELPLGHVDSCMTFVPSADKPFLATPAAIDLYQHETIFECLQLLQQKAREADGIDYHQVFEDHSKPENLWFIEDGPGGAITALLPSDY